MTVTFTHQGKTYSGELKEIKGAAELTWHLIVDNLYFGRLRKYKGKWVFDSSKIDLSGLAEEFGRVVEG